MSEQQTPDISKADFTIQDESTVVLICPLTHAARSWIAENVHIEDWQWLGPNFAVDHRFAEALILGMEAAGLVRT